jgi:hypothetical protein
MNENLLLLKKKFRKLKLKLKSLELRNMLRILRGRVFFFFFYRNFFIFFFLKQTRFMRPLFLQLPPQVFFFFFFIWVIFFFAADILSIDPSKALQIPGVLAVLTSKDIPASSNQWSPSGLF